MVLMEVVDADERLDLVHHGLCIRVWLGNPIRCGVAVPAGGRSGKSARRCRQNSLPKYGIGSGFPAAGDRVCMLVHAVLGANKILKRYERAISRISVVRGSVFSGASYRHLRTARREAVSIAASMESGNEGTEKGDGFN